MPKWKTPTNIIAALEQGDGMWEDERWSPIMLTAMSDTEFDGRRIPIAWQIEFDPYDDACIAANAKLEEAGIKPDGYGWGEHIQSVVGEKDPELAERLHTSDCEAGTCVIWVESEDDCRAVLETTWKLVFDE